jgi:hypothetical protein
MKKRDRAKSVFPTTLVGYFSLQLSGARVYNRRLIFIKAVAAEQGGATPCSAFMNGFSKDHGSPGPLAYSASSHAVMT